VQTSRPRRGAPPRRGGALRHQEKDEPTHPERENERPPLPSAYTCTPTLRRAHLCPRGFWYKALPRLLVEKKKMLLQFTT
jgi:hypothetical protein